MVTGIDPVEHDVQVSVRLHRGRGQRGVSETTTSSAGTLVPIEAEVAGELPDEGPWRRVPEGHCGRKIDAQRALQAPSQLDDEQRVEP